MIATTGNIASLEQEVEKNKDNLHSVSLDLASDEKVKKAIDDAIKKLGRIDVIVNNAGNSLVGSMEEMSDEEFRNTMDVNLIGTVNIIRNVIPYLQKAHAGHIVQCRICGV